MIVTPEEKTALKKAFHLLELNKWGFIRAAALGCTGLGASIALGATSAWLIARASQMPPVLTLSVAVVCVRLFGISKALFRYLERLASHRVALEGMAQLRTNVYDKLAHQSSAKVASVRRGDLLARTSADVDEVGNLVVKSLLPATVALILGVATSLAMALIEPLSGIVLFMCLLLSGLGAPLLSMKAARQSELAQQTGAIELSSTSLTMMESATHLHISGQINNIQHYLTKVEDTLENAQNNAARPAALAAVIDNISMSLAVLGALYFGYQGLVSGTVSEVYFAVLVLTPLASFEATQQMAPAVVQLIRSAGASQRIMDILDDTTDVSTTNNVLLPIVDIATTSPVIEAKDLAIGWPGGPIIAEGINLTLHEGRHLGIVGPSGIGKTTLLMTLAGMLEPRSGSVTVNGTPLSRLSREDCARLVTMTAEDAHIFETTVFENIRVARGNTTREQAYQLLSEAGLGQWIDSLPDGLDTQIGSGATTVSGGERRRLLLARALACPAPFMLLDEPGEHIDPILADQLVYDLLRPHDTQRSVLLVTHRLSALDAADHIIMMDRLDSKAATIVAEGTHSELYQRNSLYRWSVEQERTIASC
ncbi:MAG: thiol reductant ABC exporter subunit CydC [Actinomycetaceae bacterium]|nr:thiol reductant ABC exporter subunit CydC [Actinomycetaceae bacterium]